VLIVVACVVLLAAGLQIWAKYDLGLGDPPLFMRDGQTEYRYVPNQSVMRFGNRFTINSFSMRGPEVTKQRQPGERRVLIIGDSIVNGGARVDDADIATARLQKSLSADLQQYITVCNAACGSWGTPNQLAYAKKFGWFDAEVVVILLNSDDAYDIPGDGSTVGTDRMPDTKPWCAGSEFLARYLVAIVRARLFGPSLGERLTTEEKSESAAVVCAEALKQLIESAKQSGATVLVARYEGLAESAGIYKAGGDRIEQTLQTMGITPIDLGHAFSEALRQKRGSVFQDLMHPSKLGHQVIAETLQPTLVGTLRGRATTGH